MGRIDFWAAFMEGIEVDYGADLLNEWEFGAPAHWARFSLDSKIPSMTENLTA